MSGLDGLCDFTFWVGSTLLVGSTLGGEEVMADPAGCFVLPTFVIMEGKTFCC